jgi:hypothetical protein
MSEATSKPSGYQWLKLAAVCEETALLLARHYGPDCCIAATRILLDVFRRLNVPAQPVPVVCSICNPALTEMGGIYVLDAAAAEGRLDLLVERGAWQVVLGMPGEEAQDGKWPGHLVCVAYGNVLIDLTVIQGNRPEKGIDLPCLVFTVPPAFMAGKQARYFTMHNCEVHYERTYTAPGYESAADWVNVSRRLPIVQEICGRVLERLRL